jgi:hypothetical protein
MDCGRLHDFPLQAFTMEHLHKRCSSDTALNCWRNRSRKSEMMVLFTTSAASSSVCFQLFRKYMLTCHPKTMSRKFKKTTMLPPNNVSIYMLSVKHDGVARAYVCQTRHPKQRDSLLRLRRDPPSRLLRFLQDNQLAIDVVQINALEFVPLCRAASA